MEVLLMALLIGGGIRVPAKHVDVGRFFATTDKPPGNVFFMCVRPVLRNGNIGLCQNIEDNSYWHINGDGLVRLILEDEHDQSLFAV